MWSFLACIMPVECADCQKMTPNHILSSRVHTVPQVVFSTPFLPTFTPTPMSPHCSLDPPCRDFGTEFLTCDCHLGWLLPWARNHSLQLSERTLCAYPSALHAQALNSLHEPQLRCGEKPVPGPRESAPHRSLLGQISLGPVCYMMVVFSQACLLPSGPRGSPPSARLNLF